MKVAPKLDFDDPLQLLEIKNIVDAHQTFWVTAHVHPDGDGLGSMLMVGRLLRQLGKDVICLLDDVIPGKFDFLEDIDSIYTALDQPPKTVPEVLIALDSSCRHRLGRVLEYLPETAKLINIDHHASNDRYGHVNYIDGQASSAAEVAYRLLSLWPVTVDSAMATMIYTGIICDTGRFVFPNTSARALDICAEMVTLGASPSDIAEKVYFRSSQSTVLGLAESLSHLEFHFNGKAASMRLPHHFLNAHAAVDTEGFVDNLLAIEGTEVEFFMVEREPQCFRVSFRSKNHVNVDDVAKSFGGGGHQRAAGATICGDAGNVRARILAVLEAHLG